MGEPWPALPTNPGPDNRLTSPYRGKASEPLRLARSRAGRKEERRRGNTRGEPDLGVLGANYLGFFLIFGTFLAAGLFASSLTENQVLALVLAFGFNLVIWIIGWVGSLLDEGKLKTTIEYISMLEHIEQMSKGVIQSQDLVYFVTFIGFFLFHCPVCHQLCIFFSLLTPVLSRNLRIS